MITAPTSRDARVRDVLGLWWAEEFPHDVLPTEALVRLSEQLATLDMFDAPDSESSWTKVSSGTTQS